MTRTGVVSAEAWEWIRPLLPSAEGKRAAGGDHRQVIEVIAWRYRTGSPWRDLPESCGPWQTVWKRLDRWPSDGTWLRLRQSLQGDADAAAELDWVVSVDSRNVPAHQHAAGARTVGAAGTGGGIESHESGHPAC